MNELTKKLSHAIKARAREEGYIHKDLCKIAKRSVRHTGKMLKGQVGAVPETWQRLLDGLGLEVVVVPKGAKVEVTQVLK